jgi:hypothetical protein
MFRDANIAQLHTDSIWLPGANPNSNVLWVNPVPLLKRN